jgi:hypothetical protein
MKTWNEFLKGCSESWQNDMPVTTTGRLAREYLTQVDIRTSMSLMEIASRAYKIYKCSAQCQTN